MTRIFFFLFGFGLMTLGFVYIILYLNLLKSGYTFPEYVNFIINRVECYFTIVGFIIINLSLYLKGDKKYGLHI